jgi:hypothetical protein
MKYCISLVLALAVFALDVAPASAAPGPSGTSTGVQIADVAVVRPVSLVVAFASTGFFFGTLPLTWLTGVGVPSTYLFLIAPWRYTAAREVGEFDTYRDGGTIYGPTPRSHY